jgi:rod shape-determining protein MreC
MKKILKNKVFQFALVLLIVIFLFSVLFPNTKATGFFRNSFFYLSAGVERFFYHQGLGIGGAFQRIGEIKDLRQEKDQLSVEVRALIEENSRLKEMEYENRVLREQLGLTQKKAKYNLLATEIIGREVGGFLDMVLIDRGSQDGLAKNDPVVSGQFLIGRIKEVYSQTAQVQFITAVDSIINGKLQDSRANGLVKGGIGYSLEMESIPKNTKIKPDELVITSGLGRSLPKGLIIGRVEEVTSGQGDIFKKASLVAPVNFNSLEIVFVIKGQ